MTRFLSNRNGGGQTDEQGHYRFQTKVWAGNVLSGLAVVQNSPLARSVLVQIGDLKIDYNDYAYTAWHDTVAGEVVSIATADTSNPRIDRIVAYIDRAATPSGTNNPGILKFMAVAGTPGAVPVKINDAGVQSAVVAGNPWCELATVRVEANATTIANAKITDTRTFISLLANTVNTNAMQDLAVTTAKIANAAVNLLKMAAGTLTLGFGRSVHGGSVIPISYTTYQTVTATSTGNPVELDYHVWLSDGNSGASRTGHIRVLCDGVDVGSSDQIWYTLNGVRHFWADKLRHTPSAGSHTWVLQIVADTGSASILQSTQLSVREVK